MGDNFRKFKGDLLTAINSIKINKSEDRNICWITNDAEKTGIYMPETA
jgi:hypothetical protein